jgi:biotin operon repressor
MPDMRFAPPNPLRIADRASGLNAVSVRSYNERLVLSMLLQREATTRLEIGERTGLSAQTVSVIIRTLEQEGLVAKGEAQKGRVGPPTVPLALNPEGAFSIGISVGARHADIVLVDFVGKVRFHAMVDTTKPDKTSNHVAFVPVVKRAIAELPVQARKSLAGVGLALPQSSEHRNDSAYIKALQEEIESQLGLSVFIQNDITAAAAGESMFGAAKSLNDYLYFYLGVHLHGRLVLDHKIFKGNSSLQFDVGIGGLEQRLRDAGKSTGPLWERSVVWPDYGNVLTSWEDSLIGQMQASLTSVSQFVEVGTVILSSYAPKTICADICREFEQRTPRVKAIAGEIMPSPKAVGAAGLPFSSRFMVE